MDSDVAPLTANENRSALRYRRPRVADGSALWSLARANGLDENSPYAYLLWAEYFADTMVVATTEDDDDTPVGFVTAFARPDEPTTVFVWQIGVDEGHRRRGIAGALLDHLATATIIAPSTCAANVSRRPGRPFKLVLWC